MTSINGVSKLFSSLQQNKNGQLKVLDIMWNFISDEAVPKIADILKENNTLEELHISRNKISPEAAETIANSLVTNTTLKELSLPEHLSYNMQMKLKSIEKIINETRSNSVKLAIKFW